MMLANILEEHWGDIASLLGLVATIIGFAFTLWNVIKSKTAAQSAKDAVDELKERIRSLNTIADLTQAVAIMEEIKRLQRARQWRVVLDRYTILRKCIIQTSIQHPQLLPERKAMLTGAISSTAQDYGHLQRIRSFK
jgi:hypothetical protein